jgi:hypothetical protein
MWYIFHLVLAVIMIATGIAAFSASGKLLQKERQIGQQEREETEYWVFTANTAGFKDTSKYIKVMLEHPNDQNCAVGTSLPCVFKPATGALSTKAQLHAELQGFVDDAEILEASLRTKGN